MIRHFSTDWIIDSTSRVLDRGRMSDAWRKWHLIQWKTEMGEVNSGDLEKEIERLLPSLNEHFFLKKNGLVLITQIDAKRKVRYSRWDYYQAIKLCRYCMIRARIVCPSDYTAVW